MTGIVWKYIVERISRTMTHSYKSQRPNIFQLNSLELDDQSKWIEDDQHNVIQWTLIIHNFKQVMYNAKLA